MGIWCCIKVKHVLDIFWSLGYNNLLHLLTALMNSDSDLEKGNHFVFEYNRISSNKPKFIGLFWAILYDWWSACHNSFNLLYGWPLYLITLMVSNFCFLTQFIRFHGLLLVITISWILLSKKDYFANLTVFLYLI